MSEGILICVNCKHCATPAIGKGNRKECKNTEKVNLVTGEKIYKKCMDERLSTNGGCGEYGYYYEDNNDLE